MTAQQPGEFRISWEMPPPTVVAFDYEDRFGTAIWLKLSAEQWEALPWAPSENVTTDRDAATTQYRQLWEWAESHVQPIRNVRIEWRPPPPEWQELPGLAPNLPPNLSPHLTADWLGPARTWCCGTSLALPHADGCPFRATPDNPIDYEGPVLKKEDH